MYCAKWPQASRRLSRRARDVPSKIHWFANCRTPTFAVSLHTSRLIRTSRILGNYALIEQPAKGFGLLRKRDKFAACILRGMAKQVWMVRAGRDSVYIDEFLSRQMVAIGWTRIGDLSNVHSREQISQLVEQAWPENNKFQNSASVSQVYRFR